MGLCPLFSAPSDNTLTRQETEHTASNVQRMWTVGWLMGCQIEHLTAEFPTFFSQ